jgi:hypothetical protein
MRPICPVLTFGALLCCLPACVEEPPVDDDDDDSAVADDDDSAVADDDDSGGDDDDSAALDSTRYVVLAPDSLAEAAEAFADYREGRGLPSEVILRSHLEATTEAELRTALVERLAEIAAPLPSDRPLLLLLLGDAPGPDEDALDPDLIPALPCTSSLGPCYTDNRYGDLDGDLVPDVAVGRVPARTVEQALAYLDRVRSFESDYRTGLWNRRLFIYAGASGFGDTYDGLAESLAFETLSRGGHSFDLLAAWDNPTSVYSYEPFDDKVLELFEDGAFAGMYIGHGSAANTDGLSVDQLETMSCENRSPFLFLFACLNGNYAEATDSLAERVLWSAGGPIAAFAGNGTTHPYANAVLPYEAHRALTGHLPATFGEVALRTKQQLITNDDEIRDLARGYAVFLGVEEEELPVVEMEHLDQYNLFGDPAIATSYPRTVIDFDPVAGEVSEGSLAVAGEAPGLGAGTAWVTLEIAPTEYLVELDPEPEDAAAIAARWQAANDKVVVGVEVPLVDGRFEATLLFDPDLPGDDLFVKVYADDGEADSFGHVVAP